MAWEWRKIWNSDGKELVAGEAGSAGLRGEEGPTDDRESFGRGRVELGRERDEFGEVRENSGRAR